MTDEFLTMRERAALDNPVGSEGVVVAPPPAPDGQPPRGPTLAEKLELVGEPAIVRSHTQDGGLVLDLFGRTSYRYLSCRADEFRALPPE